MSQKELTWKLGLPAQSCIQPPNRNSSLNIQRSSNPFTLSNEPDWVTLKSSMRQGLLSRETDIGEAENEEKRSFPRQNDTGKLPSSNARYSNSGDIKSEQAEREITASRATSRVLRAKPPPIPQKPAVLIGPHEQSTKSSAVLRQYLTTPGSSELHRGGETPLLVPSTRPPTDSQTTLRSPQPVQKRSSSRDKSKNQPDLPQSDDSLLPSRGFTVQARSSRGLLDEDDNGASAIPSLQPLRRS